MKSLTDLIPRDASPDELVSFGRAVFIKVLITACVVAAAFLSYASFVGPAPTKWTFADAGQLGDYLGGVLNPVIGLGTICLLFVALLVQRHELKETARALKTANDLAGIQSFEQSFFSWLTTHRELLGSMEFDKHRGRVLLKQLYENDLKPNWQQNYSAIEEADAKDLVRKKRNAYIELFKTHRSELDAYFRTLFRLVEWIDKHQALTLAQRWHYVALVRAQLSWVELVFHFYNGFTPEGSKFVLLYNRYALFDNILTGKDLVIDCVVSGKVKEFMDYGNGPPRPVQTPYDQSAFSSQLARDILGLNEKST
jgi:hypothetical protein